MSVEHLKKILADLPNTSKLTHKEIAQAIHAAGYRRVPDEVEMNYSYILYAMSIQLTKGIDFAPSFPFLSKQLEACKAEWMKPKE